MNYIGFTPQEQCAKSPNLPQVQCQDTHLCDGGRVQIFLACREPGNHSGRCGLRVLHRGWLLFSGLLQRREKTAFLRRCYPNLLSSQRVKYLLLHLRHEFENQYAKSCRCKALSVEDFLGKETSRYHIKIY